MTILPSFGSDCVLWTRAISDNGYGKVRVGDRVGYAHRIAHEVFVGPIPTGLQIDHLCRVRACVNPLHLEAVTQKENIRRSDSPSGRRFRATACEHGHPFDEINTIRRSDGYRECRQCRRDRDARLRQARRRAMALHPAGKGLAA